MASEDSSDDELEATNSGKELKHASSAEDVAMKVSESASKDAASVEAADSSKGAAANGGAGVRAEDDPRGARPEQALQV